MGSHEGRVGIPGNARPWTHELETARALAAAGRVVRFVAETSGCRVKSADIQMDGMLGR